MLKQKLKNLIHLVKGRWIGIRSGSPTKKIKLIGVTGTNGKTTIATLMYELFTKMGIKAGLMSTIEYRIGSKKVKSTLTTPDIKKINKLLNRMIQQGCQYCFMEVSSHALDQNRVAGLRYKGAIFTNITRDHLDYHGTFDNYVKAKKKFFDHLDENAFGIVNVDNPKGKHMLSDSKAKKLYYGMSCQDCDFNGEIVEGDFNGLKLKINDTEIESKLVGKHNAYNLLAIYGASVALGIDEEKIRENLPTILPARGRFQLVKSKEGVIGIVDYAHTPDALENVLQATHKIRNKDQRIITIAGCGGDRDKGKRPMMAKIAKQYSDVAILTSDNPRTEKPEQIIEDMKKGLSDKELAESIIQVDREKAIQKAVSIANPGDIILVAGKGHEDYQEVDGVKHHFDDAEELKKAYGEL